MAGLGPQGPPGGMPPGAPAPGGPPPGMPGPMLPPGAMPPGMPSMGIPPPMGGPSSDPFTDLSETMPPHYQLIDAGSRMFKKAVETGGFYQEPEALAGLRELIKQADRIVVSYHKRDEHDISASMMGEGGRMIEADEEEGE